MNQDTHIWVGQLGVYRIPPDVIANAQAASPGKRLKDRRTKAHRVMATWAMQREREELEKFVNEYRNQDR